MSSVWLLGNGQKPLRFAAQREIVQNHPITMQLFSASVTRK